jgi:hypothetical protein
LLSKTQVLFNNHASLLLKRGGKYLLTDPWFQSAAFGSWLPTFPQYIHPVYLAAIKNDLTVLISHGHDDHFDDKVLSLFDKETHFITANFKAPSVIKRLSKLGFHNVTEVSENGYDVANQFFIRSFIVEEWSHDDAAYTIRTNEGVVLHLNDNWREFDNKILKSIELECEPFDRHSILLFSQTNSASGYPLTYRNYSENEKIVKLKQKVASRVLGGLRNADSLGLSRMFSYAGFSLPFVEGKQYHKQSLFPTAGYLQDLMKEQITPCETQLLERVKIEDLYPGDSIDLESGTITKGFVSFDDGYDDAAILEKSESYYAEYGMIAALDTFKECEFDERKLDFFLEKLNEFVINRVTSVDSHYSKLIGKTFEIVVEIPQGECRRQIKFGEGLIRSSISPNERCYVKEEKMQQVLDGEYLFENLYTGYNAEWEKYPEDGDNGDIIMSLVAFSYVYINRLAATYRG